MSRTIQQKQIEYFTKYAGYCLKIWSSIVGQQITHYRHGPGTVVKIRKIKDGICVEVQFAEKPGEINFRLEKIVYYFSRVFTHLTLPREVEQELETRYWDFIKEDLIYELMNLASHALIDQSTFNTFDEIYDRLMRVDRTRQLSEQDIQKINEYQKKLMDRMICELRNLASRALIDQSTFNTSNKIYDWLMTMNQKQKLPEQTIQEINGYQKKLMDRKRLSDLSEKAMNSDIRAYFPLPELENEDIRLVDKWCNNPMNNLNRTSLVQLMKTDSKTAGHLCRLLSARFAEKIAMYFYHNHDKTVEDISITQINKNNNSDWCKYDLKVDGYPVDVKNSRQSQKSKDRYTEYCIPRFKSSREGQNVIISGVFSPYIRASKLSELLEFTEHHKDAEILFLGETTLEKQERLKEEFGSLVHFKNPNPTIDYLLPPWMFDYPKYVYTKRGNALNKIKDFSDLTLLKDDPNLIPVAIAAGIDLKKILDKKADYWKWRFLNQLCNRIKKYGLSLPFLFLTILDHFLDMATGSKTVSDFEPENYREFLFYKRKNNLPLGIYDPLRTIDSLIKALRILWTAESESIRKFCEFRLVSFNILQGKSNPNDRLWTTLIAYCGGKIKKAPCGMNPLVLGESELCGRRKLICPDPDCGYCCETCKRERSPTDSTHAAPTGGFNSAGASEMGGSDGYPPY